MDAHLWRNLQHVVRKGNKSAHTGASEGTKGKAILSLNILFDFVQWIDYCYGTDFEERKFDTKRIPDQTEQSEKIRKDYEKLLAFGMTNHLLRCREWSAVFFRFVILTGFMLCATAESRLTA